MVESGVDEAMDIATPTTAGIKHQLAGNVVEEKLKVEQ